MIAITMLYDDDVLVLVYISVYSGCLSVERTIFFFQKKRERMRERESERKKEGSASIHSTPSVTDISPSGLALLGRAPYSPLLHWRCEYVRERFPRACRLCAIRVLYTRARSRI